MALRHTPPTRIAIIFLVLALFGSVRTPARVTADQKRERVRAGAILRAVPKLGGRISSGPLTSTVAVKFREGCSAQIENGRLSLASAFVGAGRADEIVNRGAIPGRVGASFDAAGSFDASAAAVEKRGTVDLPTLSLWVDVEASSPEAALELARTLDALDEVETAYVEPVAVPFASPSADLRVDAPPAQVPTTPNFANLQSYLAAAPGGHGVISSRDLPTEGLGRGRGVRIVDIEYSWNLDHEDLPFTVGAPGYRTIAPFEQSVNGDGGLHGTAVLGILLGMDNEFGVTGICPDADIGLVNAFDLRTGKYDPAKAILRAAGSPYVREGDIIQLEQQTNGPTPQIPLVPLEWIPKVFDAIQHATSRGFIVVEPAGNGNASLDDSAFAGAFKRKPNRDSGAIVVGAGNPPTIGLNASRTRDSNYGARVDVQGYGLNITSTGDGDLWPGPGVPSLPSQRYTNRFGGTSGATACITGIVTLIQAARKDLGFAPLDATRMRSLVTGAIGSPDNSPPSQPIGPRPDAASAVGVVSTSDTPFVATVQYKAKKHQLIVDGLFFKPGQSSVEIEINGTRHRLLTGYPDLGEYGRPDGTTTRVVSLDEDLDTLIPPGALTVVTVVSPGSEPGTELRSPIRYFRRR